MKRKSRIIALAVIAATITPISSCAQHNAQDSIQHIILSLDSMLFNVGFNQCKVQVFEDLLAEDFEFYHDKAGKQNKAEFLISLRNGLCADVLNYQSTRTLHQGSTKIHLLFSNGLLYGALQEGTHSFYENISNQPTRYASTAEFTHYWEMLNGQWKLKRSFSFDHHQ